MQEGKTGLKIIGIDIGGTGVKGVIIDEKGEVYVKDSIPTEAEKGADNLVKNIAAMIENMLSASDISKSEVAGVGLGCPGLIDSRHGTVVFAGNLYIKDYPLSSEISKRTGLSARITNDANAAALGEARFGAGRKYEDSILVTLGTGVGGGIVIGGRLFEGGSSAGTEIGHTVIVENGIKCTCGRRGCFERYASARALTAQTRAAMVKNPGSPMWKTYDKNSVCGKTPFDYMDDDPVAKSVVDGYIKHLACGIVNVANVFRPQVVMLGGGVSEQGERLTKPLQEIVDREIFVGTEYAPVKVVKATLGSDAGAFGAASLWIEN